MVRSSWLLALLLWQPCMAQLDGIFQYPPEKRVLPAFHYVWTSGLDSTEFAQRAGSVLQWAETAGDDRLAWYIRLFVVAKQTEMQPRLAVAETPLFREKERWEAAPYADVKATFWATLSVESERRGDYEGAFHYLIAAAELFEKTGWDKVPMANWYATYFFDIYYRFGDYQTALHFGQIALDHPTPGQWKPVFLLTNLGEAHLRLKNLPKVQALFRQVIDMATNEGDNDYIGIGSSNYGNTLRLQGLYREALPYLYRDVELNEITVPENSALSCAWIADCLLHLDSVDKAG